MFGGKPRHSSKPAHSQGEASVGQADYGNEIVECACGVHGPRNIMSRHFHWMRYNVADNVNELSEDIFTTRHKLLTKPRVSALLFD